MNNRLEHAGDVNPVVEFFRFLWCMGLYWVSTLAAATVITTLFVLLMGWVRSGVAH